MAPVEFLMHNRVENFYKLEVQAADKKSAPPMNISDIVKTLIAAIETAVEK